MKKEIVLGYIQGMPVEVNQQASINGHIALIGASGSGKTVEAQRIICENLLAGRTVVVLSYHGSFAETEIFGYYETVIKKFRNNIDVHKEGIPCRLFERLVYLDGTTEQIEDTVSSVADIVSRALKLGRRQKAILQEVIQDVVRYDLYKTQGFSAIGEILRCKSGKGSEALYEVLKPLFRRNLFYEGEGMLQENKLNIIHLEKLDATTQEIMIELCLSYIWRLALAEKFKRRPITLFLDECQNMDSYPKSSLSLMISEGRKLGINLILATQILTGNTNSVQQRITQCGLMLYFKPAVNRVNQTAKMIGPGQERAWATKLRRLKIGEFVAVGEFNVSGRQVDYPLVVNSDVDTIRKFKEEKCYGSQCCDVGN